MTSVKTLASSIAYACLLAGSVSSIALAAECSGTIRILAQPRDGLTLLEGYKGRVYQALRRRILRDRLSQRE
jgi:multiple sugar transport system substrate-binding protein